MLAANCRLETENYLGGMKWPWRDNFKFLIIGAGRSGTSLLAALLDGNPALEVGLERFAFDCLLGEKLAENDKYSLEKRMACFLKNCQKEARRFDEKWGNKITTEQIWHLQDCGKSQDEILAAFTETVIAGRKVVFIVRDGRACVKSKMERAQLSYEESVKRWKKSCEISRFLEKEIPDKILVLKYEDLIENSKQILSDCCDFLETQFSEKMLSETDSKKMHSDYRQNAILKKERTDFPKEWTMDMENELRELGYL